MYDEPSEFSESPCSSVEVERGGTLSEMLKYGITPPSNFRQRKLFKERDRNQKIKVAKRETSLTKTMAGRVRVVTPSSTEDSEEIHDALEAEPPPGDVKRRKDSSKNFKTSRAYDRDYKHSASDVPSLDDVAPKQLASSSNLHQIHVDSPNRFLSLNSKPVSSFESKSLVSTVGVKNLSSRRQHSFTCKECPKDRYEFHQLFTQLIGLHLKPKAEKENKSREPISRQVSADQELWQNEMSDVLWLNIKAWQHERTMQQQDEFLYSARTTVPDIIKQIMQFKIQKLSNSLNPEISQQVSVISFTSDSSGVYEDTDNNLQFPLETDQVKTPGSELKEQKTLLTPFSGSQLSESVKEQQHAVKQVTELLNRLDYVHELYPSMKAIGKDHPQYNDHDFQFRLDVLNLWLNLTRGIGEKIQLMASVLGLDGVEDLDWPWLQFDSAFLTLQNLREGMDILIPDLQDSDEEDYYDYHSAMSTPLRQISGQAKQTKLVTFDMEASSKSSSGATTPSASSAMLSPSDSSTPRHQYRMAGVPHSNSYLNIEFSTRTSLYR